MLSFKFNVNLYTWYTCNFQNNEKIKGDILGARAKKAEKASNSPGWLRPGGWRRQWRSPTVYPSAEQMLSLPYKCLSKTDVPSNSKYHTISVETRDRKKTMQQNAVENSVFCWHRERCDSLRISLMYASADTAVAINNKQPRR